MPFVEISVNIPLPPAEEKVLKTELGSLIALIPGKSEDYLMIKFNAESKMWMKGTDEPSAMVDVMVYGAVSSDIKSMFTEKVMSLMTRVLDIERPRMFLKFNEVSDWF